MIFNQSLLYIHAPKTGGMSLTRYLLSILPRPVYYTHPFVGTEDLPSGVEEIHGKRHESLAEARDVAGRYGFSLDRFPLILVGIRNPYELEVSRYAYLRMEHPWEMPGTELRRARDSSFEEFATASELSGGHWWPDDPLSGSIPAYAAREIQRRAYPNDLAGFYTVDGRIPANLRMIRFENMADELADALGALGIETTQGLPWANQSPHDHYLSYYTPRAEEAVYRRYRWAFDQGFYPRLESALLEPALGA